MLSVFFKKSNDKGSQDGQLSYRQQVIRALVQRYIESARREFEETKRKGNDSFSKHLICFCREDISYMEKVLGHTS